MDLYRCLPVNMLSAENKMLPMPSKYISGLCATVACLAAAAEGDNGIYDADPDYLGDNDVVGLRGIK